MKHTKRIQRYLDGNMSPGEKQKFREDLETDRELAEAFHLYKLIDHTIEEHDEIRFRHKLRQFFHHSTDHHDDNKDDGRRKTPVKKLYIVSATLAIIGLTLFLYAGRSKTPDEIYARYYSRYTQDILSRSPSSPVQPNHFTEGIYYYRTNDYKSAVIELSGAIRTDSTNITARFYRGLAEMENSNFRSAAEDFRFINKQRFNYFQEHSHWYLGLSLLKLGLIREARDEFRLLKEKDTYYVVQASKILRMLPKEN